MSQSPLEAIGGGPAASSGPPSTTPPAAHTHVTQANVGNLVCGRCRRKTGETVSKLCHACGVPLHPSCSDDVAARECQLAYGFPVPTGFCSKRCYESDLLAHGGHHQQQQQHQQQQYQMQQQAHEAQKRLPHVPSEITATLTVKIGDVGKTSRKHLSVTTFRFLLSEGFKVFKAKANTRTTRELQQHAAAEIYVRDDRAIYIKPGVHSKQAELVELTERNFEARIARSYRNFLKRKPGSHSSSGGPDQPHFECEILTYVKKDTARRRTGGAILKQQVPSAVKTTSQMHSFMEYTDQHAVAAAVGSMGDVNTSSSGGGVSDVAIPMHAASMAMTIGSVNTVVATPVVPGGDLTSSAAVGMASIASGFKRKHSQMLLSDPSGGMTNSVSAAPQSLLNPQQQQQSESALDPNQDPSYRSIRMILNGQVVSVKVNVRDLLACFTVIHAPNDNTSNNNVSNSGVTHMQDL